MSKGQPKNEAGSLTSSNDEQKKHTGSSPPLSASSGNKFVVSTPAGVLATATTSAAPIFSKTLQQPQNPLVAPATIPLVAPTLQHTQIKTALAPTPLQLQYVVPFQVLQTPFQMMFNTETQISPIFRNRKLRSGKWTPEEEEYAELLIELFEKGHIDEKNGRTLRSFLSRRLHCAPMRISKKYAGKGIGKMVFLSKNNNGLGGIGSPSYTVNMTKLREKEENFLKSAFPGMVLVSIIGTLPGLGKSPTRLSPVFCILPIL